MKIALRKREAQGISAVPVIRFFVLEYTPPVCPAPTDRISGAEKDFRTKQENCITTKIINYWRAREKPGPINNCFTGGNMR